MAYSINSIVFFRLSFSSMFFLCVVTVRELINKSSAISFVVLPFAIRARISYSREDRTFLFCISLEFSKYATANLRESSGVIKSSPRSIVVIALTIWSNCVSLRKYPFAPNLYALSA